MVSFGWPLPLYHWSKNQLRSLPVTSSNASRNCVASADLNLLAVRKLLSDAYERTKELLQQNKESLTKVAELLLKKEVIFKEDLEGIMGKRPDGIALQAPKKETPVGAAD